MTHKFAVVRNHKYPFLTLQKIYEGSGLAENIALTGDELQDYEDAVRNFSKWQGRLADADFADEPVSDFTTADIASPAGGANA